MANKREFVTIRKAATNQLYRHRVGPMEEWWKREPFMGTIDCRFIDHELNLRTHKEKVDKSSCKAYQKLRYLKSVKVYSTI